MKVRGESLGEVLGASKIIARTGRNKFMSCPWDDSQFAKGQQIPLILDLGSRGVIGHEGRGALWPDKLGTDWGKIAYLYLASRLAPCLEETSHSKVVPALISYEPRKKVRDLGIPLSCSLGCQIFLCSNSQDAV